MNTFGFIGCGNMGGTLAVAVSKSVGDKIAVADFDRTKIENISKQTGADAAQTRRSRRNASIFFSVSSRKSFPL